MKIEPKTASLVELPRVLEKLSRKTRSETGQKAFVAISPARSVEQALHRQSLLKCYIRYRDTRGEFPWDGSVRPVAQLLESTMSASFLSGGELLRFRILVGLALRIRGAAHDARGDIPGIEGLAAGIRDMSVEFAGLQVIADDGELYDHASPDLERVRRDLHEARTRARNKCSELSGRQSLAPFLQDRVTHLRKGRLALLVRLEDASRFDGIVLDRSGSGKGVYVEPRELVGLNNRIEILRSDVAEEERKILTRLTAMIIEKSAAILDAENAVALIDIMHACARIMEEPGWSLPELEERPRFHFLDLWNPLIGSECVPINIHCGERFRQLVITGPNTGGKTVVLKSVSIAVFLALSGLPVPAAEGSVVGAVDFLAADIGDEQGIEQSLSTFSSHISRIVMMINSAGPDSLLFIDELGAGTDPQEGAALGMAILEKLREKRCLVLATTHHNPIKKFAVTSRGVESASMEFDPETFSPTFKLMMGVPGKSNAILIAQRLGMPDDVIAMARENLSGENRSAERLMDELFDKQVELERAGKESADERRLLASLKKTLVEKTGRISLKEGRMLMEADVKARKILEEAESAARDLLKRVEGAAESAARREFEKGREGVVNLKNKIAGREESLQKKQAELEGRPEPGDTVKIAGTEARGVVESIDGEKAVVEAGALRIDVPLKNLVKVKEGKDPSRKTAVTADHIPAPRGVPSSIMVRGMTLDEAMPEVGVYLDRAFRAGFGEVVVIHGRGEGILRRAVHDLCGSLHYVTGYRLGNADEGGYGVTVVSFGSRKS
ncbi:MAG: Smr/MutS family protein [Thermovirgaceae bacterium]|nr:Smr/MutS family protein [Thermovirgaceae bacterium]